MNANLKCLSRVDKWTMAVGSRPDWKLRWGSTALTIVCVSVIMQMMLSGCGGSNYGGSTNTPSSGRFSTLAPGSALPSESDCAAHVRRSSFEPRPDNTTANNDNVFMQGGRLSGSYLNQYGYESRVTGNFTGTTDEIIQWGACKWGIDEDIVRAQSVQESYWHQSTLGDCGGTTQPQTNGCASVGLLQVKGADIPPTHPGTWPYAYQSTAFNVDYMLGVLRACYEGKETWLGNGYHAGDIWGCVGRWFSGDWYIHSQQYIANVQSIKAQQVWLSPGF
jgi:autotransporter family porin